MPGKLIKGKSDDLNLYYKKIIAYSKKSTPAQGIITFLKELTGADDCVIALLDKKSARLIDKYTYYKQEDLRGATRASLPEELFRKIIKGEKLQLLSEEEINKQISAFCGASSYQQLLLVPSIGEEYDVITCLANMNGNNSLARKETHDKLSLILQSSFWMYEHLLDYAQVFKLSLRDDLTKAYNRRYLETQLQSEIASAKINNTLLSFVFFDLNDFGITNDRYGHYYGSHLLTYITEKIMNGVRELDKLVRYGGDEFCVVLPRTDSRGAKIVSQRILDTLNNLDYPTPDGRSLKISACFGIATYPTHAKTSKTIVCEADRAMYAAKESKLDDIVVITREISKRMAKRHVDV
jgi:diguanylate cyclase (GGDEF)-like protein